MSHPVHKLLLKFLETQQFAFDPRERALWPSERFPQVPQVPHVSKDRAAEPDRKGIVCDELAYRN